MNTSGTIQIDVVTHDRILIAAPPARIWPHVIDPSSWIHIQRLIPKDGPAGVGRRFKGVASDDPSLHLFDVIDVELIPEQRRTLRIEKPDGAFMGYSSWLLTPAGEGTLFQYDIYAFADVPADLDLPQYRASEAALMRAMFQHLKDLVEKAA